MLTACAIFGAIYLIIKLVKEGVEGIAARHHNDSFPSAEEIKKRQEKEWEEFKKARPWGRWN